jgi:hypothetical protein
MQFRFLVADAEGRGGGGENASERDVLRVGTIGVAWFQAELLELLRDVLDGLFFALRAGGASLESVGAENFDVFEEAIPIDRVFRLPRWLERCVGCNV